MQESRRQRLLITGSGRCGTHYIVDCLSAAGLQSVGHERAFNHYRPWRKTWRTEASWLAAAYLPIETAYVVHLVRHPLETIASRVARTTFAEKPVVSKRGDHAR